MQIIEKYIRSKEKYDGDLLPVINNIKSEIKLNIWDSMEVSEKNEKIVENQYAISNCRPLMSYFY